MLKASILVTFTEPVPVGVGWTPRGVGSTCVVCLPVLFFSCVKYHLTTDLPYEHDSLGDVMPFCLDFSGGRRTSGAASCLFKLRRLHTTESCCFFSKLAVIASASFFYLGESSTGFQVSFAMVLLAVFSWSFVQFVPMCGCSSVLPDR